MESARFLIVGGGMTGDAAVNGIRAHDPDGSIILVGAEVTMIFPEAGVASRVLPAGLSAYLTEEYRKRGVEVLTGETVARADSDSVTIGTGRKVEADVVVAGLGLEPATELAEAAGLDVDDGIVVDEYGRVGGREDIFAAGDVASFPVAALGRRFRVEHEDHAKAHGRAVGANMAGAGTAYDHLPFFYSDMFEWGYEAVGELDSRLETVEHWLEPTRQGTVAYVDEARRPRGFLFWNVWDQVERGRALIRRRVLIDESALV